MKTTIKFFAILFTLFIANTLQAQSTFNECVEVDMQVIYHGNDDDEIACYDVYVYTSSIVNTISIDGANSGCEDTDMCVRTLCFPRTDEAYEVFIGSEIEADNQSCRASRVGAVVTIAP